ncbi:MAG: MJ1255/VC2487 family glycosyltransferase [Candidatus Falkowbacteria bacterium]
MSKILYGVAGEGLGHAARSKVIIEYLQSSGHTVKVVSHDRGYSWLKRHFAVEEIFGLSFTYSDNEVKYIETFFKNFLKTPQAVRSIDRVTDIVNEFKPDWIISDYEPISALVGNIKRIPVISINNQHILTRTRIHFPLKYAREAIVAMLVTRMMIFKAKEYIITSFFPAKIIERRTVLVPPIIRKEVLAMKPTTGDYILVYLTSNAEHLTTILKQIKQKFIVYGLDKKGKEGNLKFYPFSEEEFLRHFAGAKAVVANAGLSLISEALYMGKPYLAIPASKQFEQVLNAYYLDKLGYGAMLEELTIEGLAVFLDHLADYRQQLEQYPRQDNSYLFARLDRLLQKKKV